MQIMGNNESKRADKRTDDHRVQSVVKQRDGKKPGRSRDEPSGGESSEESMESEGECLCL